MITWETVTGATRAQVAFAEDGAEVLALRVSRTGETDRDGKRAWRVLLTVHGGAPVDVGPIMQPACREGAGDALCAVLAFAGADAERYETDLRGRWASDGFNTYSVARDGADAEVFAYVGADMMALAADELRREDGA